MKALILEQQDSVKDFSQLLTQIQTMIGINEMVLLVSAFNNLTDFRIKDIGIVVGNKACYIKNWR